MPTYMYVCLHICIHIFDTYSGARQVYARGTPSVNVAEIVSLVELANRQEEVPARFVTMRVLPGLKLLVILERAWTQT